MKQKKAHVKIRNIGNIDPSRTLTRRLSRKEDDRALSETLVIATRRCLILSLQHSCFQIVSLHKTLIGLFSPLALFLMPFCGLSGVHPMPGRPPQAGYWNDAFDGGGEWKMPMRKAIKIFLD